MKKQHILSICIAGALLTACGSGSDGNSVGKIPTNTNINQPTDNSATDNVSNTNPVNSPLTYPHTVPQELKQAVANALKMPVHWKPAGNDKHSFVLGGKTYDKGDSINLADFDLGLSKTNYSASQDEEEIENGSVKIYRQHYSAIMTFFPTDGKLAANNNTATETAEAIVFSRPVGYFTETTPSTGKATYMGKSFYQTEEGNLNLAVDFADNTVNGEITGLSAGKVTLQKTTISKMGYRLAGSDKEEKHWGYTGNATLSDNGKFTVKMATVSKNGVDSLVNKEFTNDKYHFKYNGLFFGPNAEETSGNVWIDGRDDNEDNYPIVIGFAGQRGEIKK